MVGEITSWNGISIPIFAGIAAGCSNAQLSLLNLVRTGAMSISVAIFIVAIVFLVTGLSCL